MKKILLFVSIILSLQAIAQVNYYKGEWTKINGEDNFSGLLRLDLKDSITTGEIVWTFLSINSNDSVSVNYYKGQNGKMGIENVKGIFSEKTSDIQFEGLSKIDPDKIIGMDKYLLKLSLDKLCIYGKTLSNGENNGLVYFYKANNTIAEIEFNTMKAKVLSKMGDKATR